MVDYQTRQELNALSKDVFGSSSRWQKLVTKGYSKLVTEEVTEYVPGEKEEDPGFERKVQVPVKTPNGAHQYVTAHHTVESIRELMISLKAQRDAYIAKQKKEQEEQRLQKQIQDNLSGSAL